jgi:hypothetical protein
VFCRGRLTPAVVPVVNARRRGLGRIFEVQRAKIGNLKLDGNSTVGPILLQDFAYKSQVIGKGSGQRTQPGLPKLALEQFFLQGNVHPLVYIARGQIAVIQRKEKRVDEKYPVETFRIQVGGHRYAVRHHGLDV